MDKPLMIKRLLNFVLRRKCGTCAHWRYVRFSMGFCGKGPFLPLNNSIDSKPACADWQAKKE